MFECLIICIFVLAIYYRIFDNDLVMDSYQWIIIRREKGYFKFRNIRNISNFKEFVSDRLYSGATLGTNVRNENILTVALYAITCVLIYIALGRSEISFFASILYACNPINNQTSIWTNGRRYSINIILVLLMMIFFQASPIFYLFSGLLQVTSVFSPILLINHSYLFLILIPIFVSFGWSKIKSDCNDRIKGMGTIKIMSFDTNHLIVVIKTYGFFFFKMLIPGVCAMQYPDRIKWGLTKDGNKDAYSIDYHFYKGLLAFFLSGILIYIVPNNIKTFAIFMILSMLQWSAIIPITQILSDRYCSLPNVFMMFFVSYLCIIYANIYGIIPIVALSIYYLICLFNLFPMYKNLNDFYGYHFKYFPHLSWYRNNLIQDLMNEGSVSTASMHTQEGLKYDQKDFRLLMWGALMCFIKRDIKNCRIFLSEAEKNMYLDKEDIQLKEIKDIRNKTDILELNINKNLNLINRKNRSFIKYKNK